MGYYLTFLASETLYEEGGPLAGSDQPDTLELGPFEGFVQLTYGWLRVGPHGDEIATYDDAVWVVGFDSAQNGDWTTHTPAVDGHRFSDVTIHFKEE